jgi:hypothetical protein
MAINRIKKYDDDVVDTDALLGSSKWHESEHESVLIQHKFSELFERIRPDESHMDNVHCPLCFDRGYAVAVWEKWPFVSIHKSPCGCLEVRLGKDDSSKPEYWFGLDLSRGDPYAVQLMHRMFAMRRRTRDRLEEEDHAAE